MRTNALSTLCEKSSCKVNELKNIIVGVKQNFVGNMQSFPLCIRIVRLSIGIAWISLGSWFVQKGSLMVKTSMEKRLYKLNCLTNMPALAACRSAGTPERRDGKGGRLSSKGTFELIYIKRRLRNIWSLTRP
jgi:hypothetical protein